jgi:demethylmenaquinone methyltransferase/2-methoxy-6-polyprenyl-1,4-benzoquinol methylase
MIGFDHFRWMAPWYDLIFRGNNREDWLRLLGMEAGINVLDAGGGTGRVAEHLRFQGCRIVVVDESEEMLRQVFKKEGLIPVLAQTERLPWSDETFQRVIMVDALHHVLDQAQTARELWRVLSIGGRLLIEEPDIRLFSVQLLGRLEKLMGMRSNFLNPPQIVALFGGMPARVRMENKKGAARILVEKLG